MIKKSLCVFFVMLLTFILTACDDGRENNSSKIPTESSRFHAQYEPLVERDFSEYIDVVLEEGADSILLWADSDVLSVKILEAVYNEETSEFSAGDPLVASIDLPKGTAIRLKRQIPEAIPNTMVQYKDGQGNFMACVLSFNGKDGSIHTVFVEQ